MTSPRPDTHKPNLYILLESCENSSVKHSEETPVLLNYVNLHIFSMNVLYKIVSAFILTMSYLLSIAIL